MKIDTRLLSAYLLSATMATFSVNAFAESKIAEADIIATVNGQAISIEDRTRVTKQLMSRGQQVDEARVTEELVNLELMKQEAVKLGLESDPEVIAQLEILKTRILANAAINALTKDIKITDEDIKAEYDQQVAKIDAKEFKASHILLEDEATAIAVIAEIEGGADFATVAKEKSTGPSGPNGGDLGWFNAQSMVPEFSQAVGAMKKGDVSSAPVKTQFGYHVIKLDDTRDAEKPQLEQVRAEIEGILTQNQLAAKLEELRKGAEVVIK